MALRLTLLIGLAGLLVTGAQAPSPLSLDCTTTFPAALDAEQLRSNYGAANVRTEQVLLGEGEFALGTILYPTDLHRRVAFVWRDSVAQRAPRYVFARDRSDRWRSPSGISLGTTLRQLERLNGRAFVLAGFAFDGSGAVISWANGRLEEPPSSPCHLRVRVDSISDRPAATRARWAGQVSGGRDFPSAHPAMQALNPKVSELWLEYRD